MTAYAYIERTYGYSFIPGERVVHTVTGRAGVVCPEGQSQLHYVQVRFDGQGHSLPCHPGELKAEGASHGN